VRGIGRQWTKLLEGQGVTTALAFSQQSDAWLKKHLNVVGQRTAWELRGIPCIVRRQTRLGDGGHHEKPALHDRLAAVDADQNLTDYFDPRGNRARFVGFARPRDRRTADGVCLLMGALSWADVGPMSSAGRRTPPER
jgi:hypothetical protein